MFPKNRFLEEGSRNEEVPGSAERTDTVAFLLGTVRPHSSRVGISAPSWLSGLTS